MKIIFYIIFDKITYKIDGIISILDIRDILTLYNVPYGYYTIVEQSYQEVHYQTVYLSQIMYISFFIIIHNHKDLMALLKHIYLTYKLTYIDLFGSTTMLEVHSPMLYIKFFRYSRIVRDCIYFVEKSLKLNY